MAKELCNTATLLLWSAIPQDLAHTLREVAAELRAVRAALDSRERGDVP